jgi:hypothetical protein
MRGLLLVQLLLLVQPLLLLMQFVLPLVQLLIDATSTLNITTLNTRCYAITCANYSPAHGDISLRMCRQCWTQALAAAAAADAGDAGEQTAAAGATAGASSSKEQKADSSAVSDSGEHSEQQQPAAAAESRQSKAKQNECGHPDRKHHSRGLCAACYWQWKRYGAGSAAATAADDADDNDHDNAAMVDSSDAPERHSSGRRVNECGHPERKHTALGLCASCYHQMRREKESAAAAAAAAADEHSSATENAGADTDGTDAADVDSGDAAQRGSSGRRVNECGHPERKHRTGGRCNSCYNRWRNEQGRGSKAANAGAAAADDEESDDDGADADTEQASEAINPDITACPHTTAKHYGHGKCRMCYMVWYRQKLAAQKAAAGGSAAAGGAANDSSSDGAAANEHASGDDQLDASVQAVTEGGNSKGRRVNECGHPERKHHARGMCLRCYDTQRLERKRAAAEQDAAASDGNSGSSSSSSSDGNSSDSSGDDDDDADAQQLLQQQADSEAVFDEAGVRVITCGHPDRKHKSSGMCRTCYDKFLYSRLQAAATGADPPINPKITACPHTTAVHKAKGMCLTCYRRHRAAHSRAQKQGAAERRGQQHSGSSGSEDGAPDARQQQQQQPSRHSRDKPFAALLAEALATGAELPVNPKITACPHTTAPHQARGRCITCYGKFKRERQRKLAAASSTAAQHSGAERSGSDSAGSQQQRQQRRRSSGEQASEAPAAELMACGTARPVNPKITACPHTTAEHEARGMCPTCYERSRRERKRERDAQSAAAPDTTAAAAAAAATTAGDAAAAAACSDAGEGSDDSMIEIVSQSDPDESSAAVDNGSSSGPVNTCGHPEKPHKALGMCRYVCTRVYKR